jgi:hypothetical protein
MRREFIAPVVAAAVDIVGLDAICPCLRLTAPAPAFNEDICFTVGILGLFVAGPLAVLCKAFVLFATLDAGRMVVEATETDAGVVRLVVVLGLAVDGAIKERRWSAVGLGMGTTFAVAVLVAPCVFAASAFLRALNDILFSFIADTVDCFCAVAMSWNGSSLSLKVAVALKGPRKSNRATDPVQVMQADPTS